MTYIGRIKDLKAALLDCERQTRRDISREVIHETEHEVLESFVNGLKSDVPLNLKIDGYRDFSDATIKAVQLAKTLEQERKRYTSRNDFPRRDNPSYEKPGHTDTTNKQPVNPKARPYTSKTTTTENPADSDVKICRYCKGVGHLIDDCRKLAYRNAQLRPQYSAQETGKTDQPRVNFLVETETDHDAPPESPQLN